MASETTVIKIFAKFIDPKVAKKLKTLDEILNLPISTYKFVDEGLSKDLEENFNIINIGEIAKLDKEKPFEKLLDLEKIEDPEELKEKKKELEVKIEKLKANHPTLEENLNKAITISSIIKSIKKESIEEKKTGQKVIVVGLDNAGKTAILTKFGGRLGISDLALIKPTKGVDRKHIKTNTLDLFIWDFGGQEVLRKKYFKTPEKYFLQIDLLIYVVDVQDSGRFDESFDYFNDILDMLTTLEENPYILIFVHKYDPDLRNDPTVLLNVEFLKDNLKELFNGTKYDFDYEIYLTSIYSLISNEPRFSKYIKNVMKAYSVTDPTYKKVEGLGRILEETMNAVIRLSESISSQLNDLDSRLRAIESGAFQIAQGGLPIEIQTPSEEPVQRGAATARSQVLNELKDLFAKKRGLDL
ncbi:MAG: ADP-ribosylation factor-like protein [Promethearchaeota archaeon]